MVQQQNQTLCNSLLKFMFGGQMNIKRNVEIKIRDLKIHSSNNSSQESGDKKILCPVCMYVKAKRAIKF